MLADLLEHLPLDLHRALHELHPVGHVDDFVFDEAVEHQLLLATLLPDLPQLLGFQSEFFESLQHISPFYSAFAVGQKQDFLFAGVHLTLEEFVDGNIVLFTN